MKNCKRGNEIRIWSVAVWSTLLLAFLLACGGQTAYAQGAKLDLSRLDQLAKKASSIKDVNLNGSMLKQIGGSDLNFAGPAGKFKDMAGRLQGVYVRKYEFDKPGEYSKSDVENLMKQLGSKGWTPMVRDVDKKTGEIKGVYMFNKGGETEGMAVIKAAPKELSVVNLVGPVNLSSLGGLGKGTGKGMGSSKPQLQHRQATTPKDQTGSK